MTLTMEENRMADQNQLALFIQGVSTWNQWREEHPGVKIDLSCAILSGADLGGVNLADSDLGGVHLNAARLIGANLSGANLQRAKLRWADLHKADLYMANLSAFPSFSRCCLRIVEAYSQLTKAINSE